MDEFMEAEQQPPVMSDEQLCAYLQEMERQAASYRSTELADEQAVALEFYDGRIIDEAEEGQSQVVVPVVQETVDYMAVSVLRTFVSGDRVVEFEPKERDAEEAAQEATEGVNHSFMREQDGYKVLHDWLKTGLIEKICAVETACVEDEKRTRRTVIVGEEELAMLMEDGNIIQVTDNDDGSFQVKLEEVRKRKRYVDMPIPNYEFLFSARTRHEDESEYLCHRTRKSISDLIQMGFDRDKVEGLPAYTESNIDARETATWEGEWQHDNNDSIPGLRKVTLCKEFARIDYDGDGVAELLRVYRVGKTILEAEEVDEQPFVVFCPFPRPHRMVGNSLADKVMDIQRNKSVILRQSFDALYQSNDPKMWLQENSIGDDTIEALLTKGPGVIVRGKGDPPMPIINPVDLNKSLSMLEYLSGEQESRTGITRLNQGLDAEAMNKTATGMALQHAQGQQMEEFVARNFAEALSRLFLKKLRLMIEHGEPLVMRVDGEYKQANPSSWPDDMGVNIRVGLGSGKKEQRLANRIQIAELQREAVQMGLAGPKQLYNTGAGIIRDSGLGDPNDYFIDPDSDDYKPPEQGQDPATMKMQMDSQLAQQKLQGEQQMSAEKLKMMREEAALQQQLQEQRADAEFALAERQFQKETELAERRFLFESQMTATRTAQDHELKKNRPGGSLAA
jgi:hypothetical protein